MATSNICNFGDNNSGVQVGQVTGPFHTSVHLPPARAETPANPTSTIIPRADPSFVDREELLGRIRAQAVVNGAWLALVGLGGVGCAQRKTQIAIKYCKDVRERRPETWILWIFAGNAARFDESLGDVADQIKLPGRQEPKADVLQLLQTWLADTRRRWLIILDNVDDGDVLLEPDPKAAPVRASKRRIDYIPACDHGTMIVTSRSKDEARKLVDENDVIEVDTMDIVHARALLQKQLGPWYSEESATQLATALDCMPLALSQAASCIKQKRRFTVEKYLAELESSRQSRVSLLQQQHGTVPKRDREASSSILLTWQISFEHIYRTRRSAADLLALMSLCDRQAIPEFLLHDVHEDQDDTHDEAFDADIEMLESFSFVSCAKDTTTWNMHRLVQDAMHWWLRASEETKKAQERYIERLFTVVPTGEQENWQLCNQLRPHIVPSVDMQPENNESALQLATVLQNSAEFNLAAGNADSALEQVERALAIRGALHDHHDRSIQQSKFTLSTICKVLGRWQEAEKLQTDILAILSEVLGKEHSDMMVVRCSLAELGRLQGRLTDAETMASEALRISETTRDGDPRRIWPMRELALVYRGQGHLDRAAVLQKKVVRAYRALCGQRHLATLAGMADLASIYIDQGRLAEAEILSAQVLDTRRSILGERHRATTQSMATMTAIYANQGRYDLAASLGAKTLSLMIRTEHEDDFETLRLKSTMVRTYTFQGRLEDADKLGVEVLKNRKILLGESHPDTLTSITDLAGVYAQQKRWEDAGRLQREAIAISNLVLGKDHPNTLTVTSDLGVTYQQQGRLQEAEELARKAMEGRKKTLGAEHPDTLSSLLNLLLFMSDEDPETLRQYDDLTRTMTRILGREHPNTLSCMLNSIFAHVAQDRWHDAEQLAVHVFSTRKRVLGEGHQDTLKSQTVLDAIHSDLS